MKFTAAQLENLIVCQIIQYKGCNKLELRRFIILQIWGYIMSVYGNPKFTGKSLATYLDSIATRAKNYKAKVGMSPAGISLSGKTIQYWYSYGNKWEQFNIANRTKYLCFNSSILRIDCEAVPYSNDNSSFTWFNFTFTLPKGSSPTVLKLNLSASTIGSLKNG